MEQRIEGSRVGARRAALRLAACLIACLAPLRPASAQGVLPWRGPWPPASLRVQSALADGELQRSESDALARLTALGPAAVPALLEELRSPVAGAEAGATEVRERLILKALAAHAAATREELAAIARPPNTPDELELTARVLGSMGMAGDLHVLLLCAEPESADAEVDAAAGGRFATAVTAILARDRSAWNALRARFASASLALQPLLARAIADSGSPEGLDLLASAAESSPEIRRVAVIELGRLAAGLAAPFDDRVESVVRNLLASDDPELAREAALACGKLDDAESVPALVALLDNANAGVSSCAWWSLRRVTGLGLPCEKRRWSAWLAGEEAWWRGDAPALFERLERGSSASRVEAINEIARHRWRRHELARSLSVVLGSRDPVLVQLACSALRELGSRACEQALVDCLEHPDAACQADVQRTLSVVRGEVPAPPPRAAVDPGAPPRGE